MNSINRNLLFEDRRYYFLNASLHRGVVCDCPVYGHLTGPSGLYALRDQLACVYQKTSARTFTETMLFQVANLLTQLGKGCLYQVKQRGLRHERKVERILEEDTQFAPQIQASVESPGFKGIPLNYQERRIYHGHEELDRRIGSENVKPELRVAPVLEDFVSSA